MASHVEQAVAARLAAVQARRAQQRQDRAERAARRRAGVDAHNRAKLARLAAEQTAAANPVADGH
ncbi:hypothetical protein [Streptomyces sp. SID8499]|uniref:hypothetical protein n=1 Tax=Streptomyces sp. SID8499 TaxID=2706106 RepID=UPI0013CAFA3F|nr:hypothetical protein [Streptomyces sp. SID8499]NED35573.1 hypothetical protein [Streptomyces sp. SID8499]